MKKLILINIFTLLIFSCGNDNDDSVDKNVVSTNTIAFQLANEFDGLDINDTNFTTVEVTNEFGTALKMNRIRYLISNVELVDEVGNKFQLKDYNLLDMSDNETFTFNGDIQIPNGNYTLNFVWGFNEEDNVDGAYADLNSASWNWPTGLGGGYHFLQFDGTYNTDTMSPSPFNFHNGTAKTDSGTFEQNFVNISLPESISVTANTTIEIKMDIAELFKNPNTWDLNTLDTPLMPNYNAQKMMQANVATVFSLGAISSN